MRKLGISEIEDMLIGCAILGTGGGGSLEKGLQMARKAHEEGHPFTLVDLDELMDDDIVVCPYFCGSISPVDPEREARFARFPKIDEPEPCLALREIEAYLGKPVRAVISAELGGGNTALALVTGASMGLSIVDADPAGRSVPEITHSTFHICGLPVAPMGIATRFGDVVIVKEVLNHERAESIARLIAVSAGGTAGVVDTPVKAADLRGAVIPGAISFALSIGQAKRRAAEAGEDAVEAIRKAGEGFRLFEGRLTRDCEWEDTGGFTEGNMEMEGSGRWSGSTLKIWLRNENMISWLDGEVYVTIPDLICVLERDTGNPIMNPHAKAGMEVSVIGFRAHDMWRTDRGLEVFGPRYLGLDMEYKPVEEVVGG
ncbi:MAG: DUF917 domain-containing protein [Bacillota bacterium]|jgi:DUF917 family protein